MQNASMTLAPVPASSTSRCQAITSRNEDNYSEANPVNLAAYADRIHRRDIDILHYPADMASCSGYIQNVDSPTKFNCPIDLAVSAVRDRTQRSDLVNSNDPVDLASYTRKQPDCGMPSNPSANETSSVSVRSCDAGNQPLVSLPQTISTDNKDQGTSSASVQPQTYHDTSALIRTLAAVSSSLTQQTRTYQHTLGLTHNVPSSYQSAHWQPVLSPHTAQLVATAVSTSGQAVHTDNSEKESERNPLLLQLQVCCGLCL